MKFDAVVFDLGGVVIDLDRIRCIEAFKRLGCSDIEAYLDQFTQRGEFLLLEEGKITAADFFDRMRPRCPDAGSDADIQDAFNQFLVDLPEERLDALRNLRRRCRTFALSNTNPVMYNSWIYKAFRKQGLAVNDYFDGLVLSFQEDCCKPDVEIFRILLRRYGLDPARTLYLDDSPANCDAAASTGLRTQLVTPQNSMLHILSTLD